MEPQKILMESILKFKLKNSPQSWWYFIVKHCAKIFNIIFGYRTSELHGFPRIYICMHILKQDVKMKIVWFITWLLYTLNWIWHKNHVMSKEKWLNWIQGLMCSLWLRDLSYCSDWIKFTSNAVADCPIQFRFTNNVEKR